MCMGMKKGLTKPDMEAAQQLVHLSSGEDEDSEEVEHAAGKKKKNKKDKGGRNQVVRKEEEDRSHEGWPRKRQRFRSLVEIYEVTKPVSSSCHGDADMDKSRGKGGVRS
ncbi:hypothetical protein MUK42_13580 [Musa troglodytarum]|uniref:Uncharacterized protein n=2 Tax=Musa troglodytarum TaxID=320322 RepID=A0A9E7I475_9LILI|nr:hypothetical protein MUK42_13580 [Musa troglodytarum]